MSLNKGNMQHGHYEPCCNSCGQKGCHEPECKREKIKPVEFPYLADVCKCERRTDGKYYRPNSFAWTDVLCGEHVGRVLLQNTGRGEYGGWELFGVTMHTLNEEVSKAVAQAVQEVRQEFVGLTELATSIQAREEGF